MSNTENSDAKVEQLKDLRLNEWEWGEETPESGRCASICAQVEHVRDAQALSKDGPVTRCDFQPGAHGEYRRGIPERGLLAGQGSVSGSIASTAAV